MKWTIKKNELFCIDTLKSWSGFCGMDNGLVAHTVPLQGQGWDIVEGRWPQIPVCSPRTLHRGQHRPRRVIVLRAWLEPGSPVVPGRGSGDTNIRGHGARLRTGTGSGTFCAESVGIGLVYIRDEKEARYDDQEEGDGAEAEGVGDGPWIRHIHQPRDQSHQQEGGCNTNKMARTKNATTSGYVWIFWI